jgi:hypothetical protein
MIASCRPISLALLVVLPLAAACAADDDDVRADGSRSTGGAYGTGTGGTKSTSDAGEGGERGGSKGGTGGSVGETGGSSSGGSSGDTGGTSSAGESSDAGAAGSADPVGVPYANVVAVATSGSDGAYTFNVSIESADIDCTQFANWWEVLAEDGALVYRRILEHSHTDENGTTDSDAPGNTFTRGGGPVPVDADDVVLVRAHMSTGGYDGVVMRGSVTGGFEQAPDIGADFASDVEEEAPQPTGCDF